MSYVYLLTPAGISVKTKLTIKFMERKNKRVYKFQIFGNILIVSICIAGVAQLVEQLICNQ